VAESDQVSQARKFRLPAFGVRGGVRGVPDEVRPRAPLFFLSYAHATHRDEPNQFVVKFFEDLSQDVAELVGRPAGSADPGFIDLSMAGGTRWRSEVLEVVGTCKVFVALLSDPYVASPECGMEWYAFSRRKVARNSRTGSGHETGIIPVLWTPVPDDRLPRIIRDVQRFSPRGLPDVNIPARYAAEGVYGLMLMGQETLYRGVVWRLAQSIAEFHFGNDVSPLVLGRGDLHDIFRERPL
jgi:TIR domain